MNKETTRNVRLGIFVLAGTIFLVASLYLIGNKRNLFSNTFSIHADFYDVNGLTPGNNVRFSGIDVGTVESVDITHDRMVIVTIIIDEKYRDYIHKHDIATIGTDGLMGNKLININSVDDHSPRISDGDTLATLKAIETEEMTRTLSQTNDNMKVITDNLKTITQKINNSNSLWSLLADTAVAENVRQTIVNIRLTSERSAVISGDLGIIAANIRSGQGPAGMLISDTTISGQIRQSVVNFKMVSDKMAIISGDLSLLTARTKDGEGTIGTLMMDTTLPANLNQAVLSIRSGTAAFDENMEALKHSFLLKGYFRRQEKKKLSTQPQTK
jgi:phospholipid/cholesterol/gamma-HCH transport system substrate-binding protein